MSTLLYNPDRKSKDQLISEFVVRTKVYDEITHDLETSKMEFPEQHYLLVGQRGAGKTTLLNRLKYGIQDSEKLKDALIPVIFNEEQYNISELANLWESIGQFLEDYQGFDGIYSEIEKNIGKKNFEELSYDILEKYLRKYNKRIVLLLDNIGDILKKLDKTEIHRLREVLQTKKEIRLIAASPFYLETILDYQQPLFEFFKVVRLDGLNEEETRNLLLKLGELNNEKQKIVHIINETPERIETLRTLTGGVPRTIALMYRIFTEYNDENTLEGFGKNTRCSHSIV
jgi:GTPase SAR1 family protein